MSISQQWMQKTLENARQREAAEDRRLSGVSECTFDYCMHYDEERRRCSLRYCFYDRKYADRDLDSLYKSRKRRVKKWPHG